MHSQNIEEDSQRNAAARNNDLSTGTFTSSLIDSISTLLSHCYILFLLSYPFHIGNALTDKLHHLNEQYKAPTDTSANNLFEGGDLFPSEGVQPVDTPPVPPAREEESHENTVQTHPFNTLS